MNRLIAAAAVAVSLAASAVEITVGDPLPCDPSGYPILTNDLEHAVIMLQSRICVLEAIAMSNAMERAESDRAREESRTASEAAAKADEERRKINLEFNKWLTDQRKKYGRMTLIGYDTNTCERIYVRMDGVKVRHRCCEERGQVRAPVSAKRPKRRVK